MFPKGTVELDAIGQSGRSIRITYRMRLTAKNLGTTYPPEDALDSRGPRGVRL